MFSTHLKYWLEHFRLGETLLVIDGYNLVKNPWEEFEQVQNFLNIPAVITKNTFVFSEKKGFYCWYLPNGEESCLPENKGRKHSALREDTKKKLIDFYRPHCLELFQLLGRTFNWNCI